MKKENAIEKQEVVTPVEPTLDELKAKIEELKVQKKEIQDLVEINRKEFKDFMSNNFKDFDISSDGVTITDTKYNYRYDLKKVDGNDLIRMSKHVNFNKRFRDCWHPMDAIFHMIKEKERESEEVFYEGNKIPKFEILDYSEILKNDILTNGEICERIKKYIGVDRKMRIESSEKSDKLHSEIRDLERKVQIIEDKIREEKEKEFFKQFSKEKIAEMFKNKMIFTNKEFKFKLQCNFPCIYINSMSFKKETNDYYYLQFDLENGEEENLRVEKKKFNIKNYIDFQ